MSRRPPARLRLLFRLCLQCVVPTAFAALPLSAQMKEADARRLAVVSSSDRASGYVGWEVCQGCHLDQVTAWRATKMGKILIGNPRNELEARACESCHGPAKDHVEANNGTKIFGFSKNSTATAAAKNERCLQCHEKTARTLWKGSMHDSRNVSCTDCHTVMHSNSERGNLKAQTVVETCGNCHAQRKAQLARFSHMPLGEGKLECTSCHNPHGSANDKLLIGSSVNETCFSCHGEKRGPFLWEHMPVVENCANCHDPHGSNKERLLKLSRPRLCQQCHPTAHGGSTARPSDPVAVRFTYNRECSNCHINIHGSNHPAGQFFTR